MKVPPAELYRSRWKKGFLGGSNKTIEWREPGWQFKSGSATARWLGEGSPLKFDGYEDAVLFKGGERYPASGFNARALKHMAEWAETLLPHRPTESAVEPSHANSGVVYPDSWTQVMRDEDARTRSASVAREDVTSRPESGG